MSRLSGAFWFALVIATGMTNFLVKQNVQSLDDQLTQVRKKTAEDQKKIHDLNADWTFLNQPELLADLNNRYVHLAPMSPKQVVTNLDGIAIRPTPLEEIPPPVAAATPPATPAPNAAAQPPTVASAAPSASASAQALSLISTAHAATMPPPPPAATPAPAATSAPARPQQPAPAAPPATLDGIFAQVAGGR